MAKSKKIYYYAIVSLLLCIMLSWILFNEFKHLDEAGYRSLSTGFVLVETFLGVIFVTALSIFFRRDEFLKPRTIFIYIFCGVLNLSIVMVFFLFTYTRPDYKGLSIALGLPLLLIGTNIIWSAFKTNTK